MTRTETKGEQKRTTTTKQNTSNSSYLVEVTPQILSLGTKPFVIIVFPLFRNENRIFIVNWNSITISPGAYVQKSGSVGNS